MRTVSSRWVARKISGVAVGLLFLGGSALSANVKIEHDPVKKSKSGRRIEIRAGIKDKRAGIREARAYFKSGYDSRFWFAPMHISGDKYVGILPAPALGADLVEYRIYAVNGSNQFVKTQLYSIKIVDDEDALARMQQREPTDIEIDLDRIEQARDLAHRGGEADPSTRVEVRNDVQGSENPSQIQGFNDYIVMAEATPAAAGGGLAAAATIKAGGAGMGAGTVLGVLAGAGGVAVAAGSSSDDEESSGGGSGAQSVTLVNSASNNIHICLDCSGSDFSTQNRLTPGQSRSIDVSIPGGQQSVAARFVAGRNRVVLTTVNCTVSMGTARTVRFTESGGARLRCE